MKGLKMADIKDLETLSSLMEKGVITKEEFEKKKKEILKDPEEFGPKSQLAYALLAFFFGALGVHNFYIGRWKKALAQLLITLFTLFLGSFITYLWAVINIFTISTDGKGRKLQPCNPAKYILGILGIVSYFFSLLPIVGVLSVGGMYGYTTAMNRYHANEVVSYASMVQVLSFASNAGEGINKPMNCLDMLPFEGDKVVFDSCVAQVGGAVEITGLSDLLEEEVLKISNARPSANGIVFPAN